MIRVFVVAAIALTLLFGSRATAEEHQATPATGNAVSTDQKAAPEKEQTEEEHEADIFTNGKPDAQKIFGLVLEHLHDTYELHVFSAKIPLPIMFKDDQGFHFYPSLDALEHSCEYSIKGLHELEEEKKASQ